MRPDTDQFDAPAGNGTGVGAESSLAGRGLDEHALDILHEPFKAEDLETRVERALA